MSHLCQSAADASRIGWTKPLPGEPSGPCHSSMPYRTFDELRRVTAPAVLENKRLGGLLTLIRQDQQAAPPGQLT